MNQMLCCVKKDWVEIIRNRRFALFNCLLLVISAMVLITTLTFPKIIILLIEKIPDVMMDGSQMEQLLEKLFPEILKENMGIWSSDVSVFFSIIVALVCSNSLLHEIKSGKWILVTKAGYRSETLILSKIITYGIATSFPVFISYNLYYGVASIFLENNYSADIAFLNSIVLSFSIFAIAWESILLAIIYNDSIKAIIVIITTVLIAPDIMTLFSFGKYLPTHLLTFVYNSAENVNEIIIPIIILIIIMYYCYKKATITSLRIEVDR